MEDRKENMKALSEEELEKVSGGKFFATPIHAMDDEGNALPETGQHKHGTSSEQTAVVIKKKYKYLGHD